MKIKESVQVHIRPVRHTRGKISRIFQPIHMPPLGRQRNLLEASTQ